MDTPDAADDIFTPAAFTGQRAVDAFPLDCWLLWRHRHADALRASYASQAKIPAPVKPLVLPWLH